VIGRRVTLFKQDQWDRTFAVGVDALLQALQRDAIAPRPV
jgi:hypothetical protein